MNLKSFGCTEIHNPRVKWHSIRMKVIKYRIPDPDSNMATVLGDLLTD